MLTRRGAVRDRNRKGAGSNVDGQEENGNGNGSSQRPRTGTKRTPDAAAAAASLWSQEDISDEATPTDDSNAEAMRLVERLRRLTPAQQSALLSASEDLNAALDVALSQWEEDERNTVIAESESLRPQCTCRRCYENAPVGEEICCGRDIDNCITLEVVFVQQILDRDSLLLSMRQRNALWGTNEDGSRPKQFRYHGYKNFIHWQHGYLGPNVRIPCYSCVYKKIRMAYPEPDGVYEHFQNANDMHEQLRFE